MEATVELGGVRTWYAVDGAGHPLVYLRGGFGLTTDPLPTPAPIRR